MNASHEPSRPQGSPGPFRRALRETVRPTLVLTVLILGMSAVTAPWTRYPSGEVILTYLLIPVGIGGAVFIVMLVGPAIRRLTGRE